MADAHGSGHAVLTCAYGIRDSRRSLMPDVVHLDPARTSKCPEDWQRLSAEASGVR